MKHDSHMLSGALGQRLADDRLLRLRQLFWEYDVVRDA